MMMERYDNTLDTGLLLYLKTGHMLGVPAYMHEKRALVMKRNELIRYLSHTGTRLSQNMPGKMVRILEETKNLHVAASLLQACGLAIIKPISRYVRITCSSLMITRLQQVDCQDFLSTSLQLSSYMYIGLIFTDLMQLD